MRLEVSLFLWDHGGCAARCSLSNANCELLLGLARYLPRHIYLSQLIRRRRLAPLTAHRTSLISKGLGMGIGIRLALAPSSSVCVLFARGLPFRQAKQDHPLGPFRGPTSSKSDSSDLDSHSHSHIHFQSDSHSNSQSESHSESEPTSNWRPLEVGLDDPAMR